MTNIETYREAIKTIIDYISNKYGPEEESIINMILKTKGIPSIDRNQQKDISIKNQSSINSLESTHIGEDLNLEVLPNQHLNVIYDNSSNNGNTNTLPNENLKANSIFDNSEPTLNSDNEDISEKIRSILRMANTIEELNNAIKMAYAAGLSYEANLGERKLKKLLS